MGIGTSSVYNRRSEDERMDIAMLSKRQINRIISKLIKSNQGCECEREWSLRALYLMWIEVNKKCNVKIEGESPCLMQ